MNPHDAIEQAYRNGYEAGYQAAKDEIVRCKDCRHYIGCGIYDGKSVHACSYMRIMKLPYDFCSCGERKEDVK